MNKTVLEILELCFKLKEKGHDAFFDYSPHVETIYVRVHVNGWGCNKDQAKHLDSPVNPCAVYDAEYVQEKLDLMKQELTQILERPQ